MDAYQVIRDFEQALCDYTGAPHCVVVDSCTNALMISLRWHKEYKGTKYVVLPNRTYPSVANICKTLGLSLSWNHTKWTGEYHIPPTNVWDCAKKLKRGMYRKGRIQCLSFHGKKHLPVGRGGAILTNDKEFYEWAKRMRFDGREEGKSLSETTITCLGYNCYMTPSQAARGLELLQFAKDEYPEEYEEYIDLSKLEIYK